MIGEPIELVLSPRVSVLVAELDGDEVDKADMVFAEVADGIRFSVSDFKKPDGGEQARPQTTGGGKIYVLSTKQTQVYAICSVRKINGQFVDPSANISVYRRVAKQLGVNERAKLSEWAQSYYQPTEEEVKNDPSAEESE